VAEGEGVMWQWLAGVDVVWPTSLPHCVIVIHLSPSSSHGRCHMLLSTPKVAEGEGVTWQWLAVVDVVV